MQIAINNGKTLFFILSISFVIISGIIMFFASRVILNPITKLIKSAEEITDTDEIRKKVKKIENKKNKTEVDELYNAFDLMTKGLKENLNEVTRQKKQIETILLHMTDGIIAFNLDGNIIHINPAATRLLRITDNENNFDEIFKKLKLDINMEKIIYLESWTTFSC